MPTECISDLFGFARVESRRVEAAFDGGAVTSNGGALLLGATERAIGLVAGFARCFQDGRDPALTEHSVATLVGQRVFALALGYEDLIDHDELRHDPVMAVLAGKLEARRADCAPLAGKSTLNRLEHAPSGAPSRYHKIGHDAAAIGRQFVALFLAAHRRPAKQIIIDLDATDDPPVLPRLLRLLLLSAAVHLLWPASAGSEAAAGQYRRRRRRDRGARPDRRADPRRLAGRAYSGAR